MAKRQKNGTGSFYKRKDGTVQYRVYLGVGADGKALRPSFYGKNEKEALQAYKDWEKGSGATPIEKVSTIGQWADKWLEVYKKDTVAYSTYRNYKMYVDNHIKPKLGKLKFANVRPAHVQSFFNGLTDMSESARRHINIALDGIFTTAIENRLCEHNPIKPMPMPQTDPNEIKVFTPDQLKKILSSAAKHPLGVYVLLPLYTGMRVSELTALLWSNVDLHNEQIVVRAAMTRAEDGGYEEGKTKSRKTRIVAIHKKIKPVLEVLPRNGLYVLSEKPDAPLTLHQFESRYQKFFKESGLQFYLSPHKCRHTYATYLIKGGADLRAVQSILGHSAVTTTEIYTHVDAKDVKNNVKKLKY